MIKYFCSFLFFIFYISGLHAQNLEIPALTNISVDKISQQVVINWSMNNPAAVDGYIVKRQIFGQPGVVDGSYNTIATINNPQQFSYQDNSTSLGLALPDLRQETYRIVSFKDMGAGSIVYSNMSDPSSSIHLEDIDFELCLERNIINWTAFEGYGNQLIGYSIYYTTSENSNEILLTELNNSTTTYIHNNIDANITYNYFVVANSSSGLISNSNMKSISIIMPVPPQIMNGDLIEAVNSDQLNIQFTVDPNAQVNNYLLLRAIEVDGVYDTISRYQSGISSIAYTDNFNTNEETYFYKVLAINSCGLPSRESNTISNIVLNAVVSDSEKYTNSIDWNNFSEWLGGMEDYTLYRSFDDNEFEIVSEFYPGIIAYNDNISALIQPEYKGKSTRGKFCYYIVANETAQNPYGIEGKATSNTTCIYQEAIVHLPNAFNPHSQFEENRKFKPVASFVADYELIIYDRWGSIVYQSTNPLDGWDGTGLSGKLLKKGTFVYLLKYKNRNNEHVEKSGHINLVY